jgi:hypothetical protein
MRVLVRILFITALIFCFSCEKQGLIVKCSECFDSEPTEASLSIIIDPQLHSPSTVVRIYVGDLEDDILLKEMVINSGLRLAITKVSLNRKYTVTATYYIPGNTYIVVDSATPRVRYDENQCDNPCYYVYDKTLNLKLKYQ